MKLNTEKYLSALSVWPPNGKHVLAQYDNEGIWVYQAYRPEIANHAVQHQRLDTCSLFSCTRMSWIKTNFLWMQYRSGWSTKENQERCLAIKLERSFFDWLLANAVESNEKIREKIEQSDIRLQWDPDHDPIGRKCERRAIQLGVRKDALMKIATGEKVLEILDVTDFVESQRSAALNEALWKDLIVPIERVYEPITRL
ncbi:hypothetical protein HK103_002106 [Boothiomyces macroporosus]|uniref:DUF4291 domain-containing protein n=1 Tax=Boothiomyces macroporosus TaxID=261099 RepID=A0AAD5UJY7_9FUNG|nr:hypothetical protein HK103_002106 [Boothiomyces macroporosus]